MFACRDATAMVTDESEGALSGGRGVWYRVHMAICPYCRTFRRQLRETVEIAREIPPEGETPPAEVEERLAEAFRGRREKSGAR
jgi:hypothetical protein